MRTLFLAATASLLLPMTPALAQDASQTLPDTADYEAESSIGDLAERLRDPATQDRLASMVTIMSEVLLDLPIAPLTQAMAEATGEDPEAVDPDATLRDMAPDAEDVQDEVAEKLPRMMDAMGSVAGGFEAMLPALRQMAERMEEATDDTR